MQNKQITKEKKTWQKYLHARNACINVFQNRRTNNRQIV